ncbi:uncharacterized protein MAM_06615 [Metarhizium album ARSEF 1941]|uniref:Something about silencing protein 4 domain-containing protein n=1 Tax=Metarhizium album (strain ARSEF 1941) TaxID=1081103 RepID=A0A0B2WNK4_METAS|nr:uncharacterized protein MAM_06615 [Metarhizium album ARSEF 1941]KHN95558.1 hypothetical protein MAM_06615 [Metarhizium album ARSEF 1941]
MASVTRSNRRAEGLHHAHDHSHHHTHPHSHPHPHQHPHTHTHTHTHHIASPLTRAANPPAGLFASTDGTSRGARPKRALEPVDREVDALKPKKTRIAVEILSRHQSPVVHGVRASNVVPTVVQPPFPPTPPAALPAALNTIIQKHIPTTTAFVPPVLIPPAVNSAEGSAPLVTAAPPKPKSPVELEPNFTKHQAKVINGIKAELDRLQPQPASTREQGRKLRSQEATRFKSDLSAYFPDYDEVIGNDPKEQRTYGATGPGTGPPLFVCARVRVALTCWADLLTPETPIVVVDSNPRRVIAETQRGAARMQQQSRILEFPVRGYGDSLYTDVFDSQRIDFKFLETQQTNKNLDDPLPDGIFEPSHKRAERIERSIRNSEKGRAQHEKDQIIRLLEGLQGHDWLRIMGVSGVTETRKKSFEPARAYFIKGCQAILDKFRTWNLEEKRRKLEKEKVLQAEQEAALAQQEGDEQAEPLKADEVENSTAEDDVDESQDGRGGTKMGLDADEVLEDAEEEVVTSQSDTSDASPAKQLRQEALARSQMAAASARRLRPPPRVTPPKTAEAQKGFTSFFGKKYERDHALNRTRRVGRKVLAWGHPIPDLEEADFVLPEGYRDEELLKSRARRKRRDKRRSRG